MGDKRKMSTGTLNQYYRRIKKYIELPSGTEYYTNSVIDFTESGEVGVRSMTSDDEITLKNPDALLNGEAIKTVLLSCVDGLKKPESLLTNDVDALLAAIRSVSYGESNFTSICGKCGEESNFALDMDQLLNSAGKLEPDYQVSLESGLIVHIRPFTYTDRVKMLRVVFEQEKIKNELSAATSPEATLSLMSKSINEITKLNSQLIINSVYRLHDDSNGLDIIVGAENRTEIVELMKNIELDDVTNIENKVKEINNVGIDKSVSITCKECSYTWESEFETNPVNFSLGS